MDPKKLMEMLGNKKEPEMSSGKAEAIKDVLDAFKSFADQLLAEQLKGKTMDGKPEMVGLQIDLTKSEPEMEEESEEIEKMPKPDMDMEEPADDMGKLKSILKKRQEPEEME